MLSQIFWRSTWQSRSVWLSSFTKSTRANVIFSEIDTKIWWINTWLRWKWQLTVVIGLWSIKLRKRFGSAPRIWELVVYTTYAPLEGSKTEITKLKKNLLSGISCLLSATLSSKGAWGPLMRPGIAWKGRTSIVRSPILGTLPSLEASSLKPIQKMTKFTAFLKTGRPLSRE